MSSTTKKMETNKYSSITVSTTVYAPVEKVWDLWTNPDHITRWCQASDDWHAPFAENDLRLNGRFKTTMSARDGSDSFDFQGIYTKVEPYHSIDYKLDDGRKVKLEFASDGKQTSITETFETENVYSIEQQRVGWQSILDNFRKYAEASSNKVTLHFEISIEASSEKVYKLMLDKDNWEKWTSVFSAGSRYEGSWERGSKILFLGEGKDGETGGMVSRIKENIPNKFISIEHVGIYQDGKEITSGDDVLTWAGALENYTFEEKGGKTRLFVDTDSNKEFKEYFSETWPKALEELKQICEV
jgi:uncharacterized protein YndB with AHSA1/START domain